MLSAQLRPASFGWRQTCVEDIMGSKEYVVTTRSGRWWVLEATEHWGPFVSRQVASDAAVRSAKQDFKTGQHARVSVDEPGNGTPVLYDSTL
jgi:hypothetical protein